MLPFRSSTLDTDGRVTAGDAAAIFTAFSARERLDIPCSVLRSMHPSQRLTKDDCATYLTHLHSHFRSSGDSRNIAKQAEAAI